MDYLRQALHEPNSRGVIFRRTSPQITAPGGLWDEALELYKRIFGNRLNVNNNSLTLKFPSGAKLVFRHLQHEKNIYDWQGSQLTWIGFDEGTHFSWKQINYLMSRMRSKYGISTKMRITCNPDAESWLAKFVAWWVDQGTGYPITERSGQSLWLYVVSDEYCYYETREEAEKAHPDLAEEERPLRVTFIHSSVDDTPQLAGTGYKSKLLAQSQVERERLLGGNWRITAEDGIFRREWFSVSDVVPTNIIRKVRFWDLAATEPKDHNDPDYTVGLLLGVDTEGRYWVIDVARDRLSPAGVATLVKRMAEWDGKEVPIAIEQEPGSSGKTVIDTYARELAAYSVRGIKSTGDKVSRADAVAAHSERGNVHLIRGVWNLPLLNELARFPLGAHDDQVDALSGAYHYLADNNRKLESWNFGRV